MTAPHPRTVVTLHHLPPPPDLTPPPALLAASAWRGTLRPTRHEPRLRLPLLLLAACAALLAGVLAR